MFLYINNESYINTQNIKELAIQPIELTKNKQIKDYVIKAVFVDGEMRKYRFTKVAETDISDIIEWFDQFLICINEGKYDWRFVLEEVK